MKRVFALAALALFEIAHIAAVCTVRLGKETLPLPVSWFAAAPLLALPLLLLFVTTLGKRQELAATTLRTVYAGAKGLQAVGGLFFASQTIPHLRTAAPVLTGSRDIGKLAVLLAFFAIDAILSVMFLLPKKGGQ